MTVLPNVGIHFHRNKIRNPTSYDMSLGTLWMALTCRATSSGRCAEDQCFWCLDAWIGFNWTNVVFLGPLELSTSSMPFVIVHNALAGQRQSKPWVIPSCHIAEDAHITGGQQFTLTSGTEGNRIKQQG